MDNKSLSIKEACVKLHELDYSLQTSVEELKQIAIDLNDAEYEFVQQYSKIKNSLKTESNDIKLLFLRLNHFMKSQREYSEKYRELFQHFCNRIDLVDDVYREAYSSLKDDLFEHFLKME